MNNNFKMKTSNKGEKPINIYNYLIKPKSEL